MVGKGVIMNTNDASLTSITQEIPKVFEVLLKGTRMTTKMTYLLYHSRIFLWISFKPIVYIREGSIFSRLGIKTAV